MPRTAVVITIEGSFDAALAHAVRVVMRGGSDLMLDLSRAPNVEDSALAVLAATLGAPTGPAVTIVGLSHHHERLLRYLGARMPDHVMPSHDELANPTGPGG